MRLLSVSCTSGLFVLYCCFAFVAASWHSVVLFRAPVSTTHLSPHRLLLLCSLPRQVCDTRTSAVCHGYARTYQETQRDGANASKSFIADILNSISDVTYVFRVVPFWRTLRWWLRRADLVQSRSCWPGSATACVFSAPFSSVLRMMCAVLPLSCALSVALNCPYPTDFSFCSAVIRGTAAT
jgi:hypothetical protein